MRRVTLLFFLTGLVSATWASRVPAIQERLGLSAGALGLAVLGLEAGAVAGLPAAGALVARLRSRAVLRIGFAAYPLALVAVALAPSLAALAITLATMAFANSLVDVAMNVQGVELERRARRPGLSRLHAAHAFGVLAGGGCGTAAAAAGLPVSGHFALVACSALAGAQSAARGTVREPRTASAGAQSAARGTVREPRAVSADARAVAPGPGRCGLKSSGARALPDRRLMLLGAVAFCAFLLDGAAYAWIAVHVRTARDAAPATAAAGFTAFAVALALGRLAGDGLVARHGRVAVAQGSAAVAAVGVAAALLAPTTGAALAGWAALGAGLGPIAPTVLGAAASVPAAPAAVGIASVSTIGYLGSFSGPPMIGALAGPLGLTPALGLMPLAAVTAGLLARPALAGAPRSAAPAPVSAPPTTAARPRANARRAAPDAPVTPQVRRPPGPPGGRSATG